MFKFKTWLGVNFGLRKKKYTRFYSAILIIDSGTSLTRSDAVSCFAEMVPVCSINPGNSLQWQEENLVKLSLCKCPCGLFKQQVKPWCHVCAAVACSQVSGCSSGDLCDLMSLNELSHADSFLKIL